MRRGLQIVLGLLSLIPLVVAYGALSGGAAGIEGRAVSAALDNQLRYLSTFYLSLTVLIWWMLPNIERHTVPLRILIGAIVLGGLARLYSLMTVGHPGEQFYTGMIIEFVLIIIIPWQAMVAKRAKAG
jgi:hypothetical protein